VIYGGVTIADHVRIAAHCVIVPMNHVIDRRDRLIDEQGIRREGIIIRDDVWLGARVTVLDGVTVARGCVLAAGAVVTRSTEEYGVYAGVPARLIGHRG
jgi:acetyltransferase-like isoleucine patch superfamily enzyme